jgi:hypothetical protein
MRKRLILNSDILIASAARLLSLAKVALSPPALRTIILGKLHSLCAMDAVRR